MIKDAIGQVVDRKDLTQEEAASAMTEIMDGEATPAQIACFITALRMKGETVDEITGFARVMREKSLKVKTSRSPLVDTCGTGGDGLKTFNISTVAAFVVAGGGVAVAKHGNRAASGTCGSADVLEALGVNVLLPPELVSACIEEIGIGFMFAPSLHPAMKHAVGPRKEIGVRTVFNILGPMTNPAGAKCQVLGVFSPYLTELMAGVLSNLGTERAMVVHGLEGLDEVSTTAPTQVSEVGNGMVSTHVLDASDLGVPRARLDDLACGDTPAGSGEIFLSILRGEKGPRRDIVLLNAGAAFVVSGKAGDLRAGVELAGESVDSGAALSTFERFRDFTQRHTA